MWVYIGTLCIICVLLGVYQYNLSVKRKELRFIYILVPAVLIFVSGFRYLVGKDYMNYVYAYSRYLKSNYTLLSQPGLSIVAKISSLIYDDYATWFFIMAFLTISLVAVVITKYSTNYSLCILIYIFSGAWHSGFNIVKQCAAIAIIACGFTYLRDRKFVKWCLICFAAMCFHVSAIIFVPFYFLITPKYSTKRIAIIILCGLIAVLSVEILYELISFLKGSGISWDSELSTRQVNRIRVLVGIVPFALWFVTRKHYDYSDKNFVVLLNSQVVDTVLTVATMNSVYMTRFTGYTAIFGVLFFPYLLKPFTKRSKRFLFMVIFVLYMVFWLYDLNKSSATNNFQWIFNR